MIQAHDHIPEILLTVAIIPAIKAVNNWVSVTQQEGANLFLIFELTVLVGVMLLILSVIIGVLWFQNYKLKEELRAGPNSYRPQLILKDPTPSKLGVNAHTRLAEALKMLFNIEELTNALFDLGIDAEWTTSSKEALANNIVIWMWSRGKIGDLYAYVHEKRPNSNIYGTK